MSEIERKEVDLVARLSGNQEDAASFSSSPNNDLDSSYKESDRAFETPVSSSDEMHPHRWGLGSTFSWAADKKFTKLASLHNNITNKDGSFASRTAQRNVSFVVKLQQWFPVKLLDEVIAEMNRANLSKVIGDETCLARILGFLECALRVRCRTIPWDTIWQINEELEVNLTKPMISEYRFKALQVGAFSRWDQRPANGDTFNVMRGKIAMLIPSLPVSSGKKREILELAKQLCAFLEYRHIVPKDPEVYAHAIVEMAYKKATGKRTLVTTTNPTFKTMLSTAIHYIRKKLKTAR